MTIALLKTIPSEPSQPLSDEQAIAAIDEVMEASDERKKQAPGTDDLPGAEEGEEPQSLVTMPDGARVAIDDLPSMLVFEVPDGEDGETREVSGSTLIKEGLKVLQGKSNYERDAQELKAQKEEIYPFAQLVAHAKTDPGFAQHIRQYFAGIKHHDVDPELRFSDAELLQIQQQDPARATRILAKRADWVQKEQARQYHQSRAQAEQARLWQEAAFAYEQQAESFIDSRHGKGSYRSEENGVLSYLNQMGLSPQDIQGIIDPRLQAIVFDAYRYGLQHSQMTGTKKSIEGKRQKLKPPRSQSAGTGSAPSTGTSQAKLYQKALKSQKTDDWVAALANRFKID